MQELRGRVALITGSTSGIGQAVAVALAEQGMKVVISGREQVHGEQVVEDIRRSGGEALFVKADLLDVKTPELLVKQSTDLFGRLDLIVNNAALICCKPIDEVTHEDWDRLFSVNVKAAFFIVQAALPWLRQSKGSIINVSSINRLVNAPHNFVYDTMKAALNHLTRGLALDLLQDRIRVNAIMPGGTATPMLNNWLTLQSGEGKESDHGYEAVMAADHVAVPMQIADVILLLASDRSSWINGAEIPVDGGYFLAR